MTELPPAVARFVADADDFKREVGDVVDGTQKFKREAEKAALAARRMGIAAEEAGEKAGRAGKIAADAAEKAAKGFLKEERAAELAAKAVRELERAEIKHAAAAIASGVASEKAARALQPGRQEVTKLTSQLGILGRVGPANLAMVAAGAAALPVIATAAGVAVSVGLGGALLGLGLSGSKGSSEAKAAIADLSVFAKAEAEEMSFPFRKTWQVLASEGKRALGDLSPTLKKELGELAPAVEAFARDGADSLSELKPVVSGAEDSFEALLRAVGPRLPQMMRDVASGVTSITDAVAENPEEIAAMASNLGKLVEVVGSGAGVLIDFGAGVQRNAGFLKEWANAIPGGQLLGDVFGGMEESNLSLGESMIMTVQGAIKQAEAAAEAARVTRDQAAAQWQLTGAMRDTAAGAADLRTEMDKLNGVHRDADEAISAQEESVDRATEVIKRNMKALGDNEKAWTLNTQRGRENQQQIRDMAADSEAAILSKIAEGASIGEVSRLYKDYRGDLIASAKLAGLGSKAAKQLANDYLSIPESVMTEIRANAYQARIAFGEVFTQMRTMANGVEIPVRYVQYGPGKSQVGGGGILGSQPYMKPPVGATGGLAHNGAIRRAGGGPIAGPGTATSDSIAAWLSDGEFVINAASTRKHFDLVQAINADKFATGGPVGYATGGQARVGGVLVSASQLRTLGSQLGKDFTKAATGSRSEIEGLDRRLEKAIGKLFSGKRTTLDNKLIAYLDRNTAKLATLSDKRTAAQKALTEGKEYAGTLGGAARSYAELSGLEEPTSGAQIRQGLQMKLSGITQFGAVLKKLSARGLSKGLLRQVMDMGPVDGTRYGQMLLSADTGTFRDINAVQAQIDKSSTALGRSGADLLFDAGAMAGKGFLTGLQAELKGLDKEMDVLAAMMAKSLKRALKIKSPSQHPEIRHAAAMTMAGFAGGMHDALPMLDGVGDRLATRVARSPRRPRATVMASAAPRTAQDSGSGGLIPTINLVLEIDGRPIQAYVQKQTLTYNRRNPTNGLTLPGSR